MILLLLRGLGEITDDPKENIPRVLMLHRPHPHVYA